jgi:hypothetical protein
MPIEWRACMALACFSQAISVFQEACRSLPHHFVRRRVFDTSNTIGVLMQLTAVGGPSCYLHALGDLATSAGWRRKPTPGAFSQARSKVPMTTVRDTWTAVRQCVQRGVDAPDTRVAGRRVVAIDGMCVLVPDHPDSRKRFGGPTAQSGSKKPLPQALVVMGFDVFSRVPVGASLMRYNGSERVGAMAMTEVLGPGSLAVMDRGFVGKQLLRSMLAAGGDVLLRMTTSEANSWECVYQFLRGKDRETTVFLTLPAREGIDEPPLVVPVRLVRRVFARGRPRKGQKREAMVLLTTITDPQEISADHLVALYAERWGIETLFRDLKTVFDLEAFHSRSPDRIAQEIYAALLWLTLAAAMEYGAMALIRAKHGPQAPDGPQRRQIRRTLLYTYVSRWAGALLAGAVPPDQVLAAAQDDIEYLAQSAAKRRPDRSRPRETRRPWGRHRA